MIHQVLMALGSQPASGSVDASTAEHVTPDEVDEIKRRWARVTPGPWAVLRDAEGMPAATEVIVSYGTRVAVDVVVATVPMRGRPDAEAIAHARADVPRLLEEVEQLRERVRQLQEVARLAEVLSGAVEELLRDRGAPGRPGAPPAE